MYEALRSGPAVPVFVDSSAFVAHFHTRDRNHGDAAEFFAGVRDGDIRARPLLTSEYVVDETATTLLARGGHGVAATAVERLRDSSLLRVRHVDPSTYEAACDRFVAFDDQPLSFTDHVIGLQARSEGADHVLTFDGGFEALGLSVLPTP